MEPFAAIPISVDEALDRVLAVAHVLSVESVPLLEAEGRVLAVDLSSPIDLPPFANSAMDGYAMRAIDTTGATVDNPVRLAIIDRVAAGSVSTRHLTTGQAARIMTGAPIPAGADVVIPFELVREDPPGTLVVNMPLNSGNYIRLPGEDVTRGDMPLTDHMLLGPAALGLAASMGFARLPCYRRPRVAILGTGDELVPPGEPLLPGQIYDSNDYMLAPLARRAGAEVIFLGRAGDSEHAMQAVIAQSIAAGVDFIVTSGGVSVGDFDMIKEVLRVAGQIAFWRIRMRPGKPLAFGTIDGIPLLGLPGNPIAAFVGFMLFGRSLLRRMQGQTALPAFLSARCGEPIRNGSGKRNFLRGRATIADGQLVVRLAGGQLPSQLAPLVAGNCLIAAHEDRTQYDIGELIPILPLDDGSFQPG